MPGGRTAITRDDPDLGMQMAFFHSPQNKRGRALFLGGGEEAAQADRLWRGGVGGGSAGEWSTACPSGGPGGRTRGGALGRSCEGAAKKTYRGSEEYTELNPRPHRPSSPRVNRAHRNRSRNGHTELNHRPYRQVGASEID